MTIQIPAWPFQALIWLLWFLVAASLLYASVVLLHKTMKRRKVYGCAILYLTTKANRDKADFYSYSILHLVAELIRKENPRLYADVGELFAKKEEADVKGQP